MPNFALANGLWIGTAPNNGTKINNGKRNFNCKISMSNYIIHIYIYNKGNIIGQHTLKGNAISFA
jgi:hypothetical protein